MSMEQMDISMFLDYESDEIVFPIIIFVQIKAYVEKHNFQKSFYRNIKDMLHAGPLFHNVDMLIKSISQIGILKHRKA